MGLGLDPLGDGLGPFGGPGLITIKGVVPLGMSEVIIVLDRIPKLLDDGAFDDASLLSNYAIVPIDPTELLPPDDKIFIPAGKFVPTHGVEVVGAILDPDDPKQIILTTDSAIERWVDYSISMFYVKGAEDEDYAGPDTYTFRGLTPSRKRTGAKDSLAVAQDPYLDIANNFAQLDENGSPSLTGWQLDSGQRFAKHGGLATTRKRISRRIFSGSGRYLVYGSNYGVDLRPKTLVRPGDLQRLENALAEQIRREPDVLSCIVSARIVGSNTIDIEARVEVRIFGITTIRQVVAIP